MPSRRLSLAILGLGVLVLSLAMDASADHHRRQRQRQRDGKHCLPPVTSPAYRTECGACHFAYPPALLPSGSWRAILQKLPEHFGEQVDLDPARRRELEDYLAANAAERCGARLAGKIMASLGGQAPLRVSQVPYLVRKHQGDDLPADAFSRPGVGSPANCAACHTGADQGDFDEHRVRIPPR
ncbi:MAG: diheme cytochrome c [Desulfarculus sp.]|nr:diheme cytochrome c [Desulfarculus sp.]